MVTVEIALQLNRVPLNFIYRGGYDIQLFAARKPLVTCTSIQFQIDWLYIFVTVYVVHTLITKLVSVSICALVISLFCLVANETNL